MNYALKRIYDTQNAKYAGYDIELRPAQNIIIYRDHVMRLSDSATMTAITRQLKYWLEDAKKRRADGEKAKQTHLFGE
jgi:hypothetical protein